MTHLRVVTNSERSLFACPRRWFFASEEGLTTSNTPAPLRGGGLMHDCLAAWYTSELQMTHTQIVEQVITPWMERRTEWLRTAFPDDPFRGERLAAIAQEDAELVTLVGWQIGGYIDHWMSSDYRHLEVLAVEPQVARWLEHPRTGKPIYDFVEINGKRRRRRWAYGGAVDLLVRDTRDGLVWMMEHKGGSERDIKHWAQKRLKFDPQTRGYAWALQAPIPEASDIKEPVRVHGLIYNVLRKAIPATPHMLKNGKGLSKAKNIDTTREMYRAHIDAAGFDPDDYTEILERLRNNRFFHREPMPFTPPEIADFGHDLTMAALQIRAASRPGTYHPRQQALCTGGFGNKECRYQGPCLEDGQWARAEFTTKTIRHEELRGDLCEPYMGAVRGLRLGVSEKTRLADRIHTKPSPAVDADGMFTGTDDRDPFAILD